MKRLMIAALLFGLLFPSVALAQQDSGATETDKVTEYEFKGIDVGATRHMPPGEDIGAWLDQRPKVLYEARQNFVPELIESTREL